MYRLLICTVMIAACAAGPRVKGFEDCTDVGTIGFEPRSELLNETQTMGPSQVIWIHPPETMKGYFKEAEGHVFRCPSPR